MVKMPDVNCRYGAPMGRPSIHCIQESPMKFSLQWVRLDSGGYDNGGAYWGIGQRLYWAAAVDETTGQEVSEYYRGASRAAVKAIVRKHYPGATFNGGGNDG